MDSLTILHIPHASLWIPQEDAKLFLVNKDELQKIIYGMTDWYTQELYPTKNFSSIIAQTSRLVVDVERFENDALEPMAKVGQGVLYTHANGTEIRKITPEYRLETLKKYYFNHYQAFDEAIERKLARNKKCLIIDCHSYSAQHMTTTQAKPEICIGTDPYHTPDNMAQFALAYAKEAGFTTGINTPFAGTIVPQKFYHKDPRVCSIMLEIDRGLYLEDSEHKHCPQRGKNFKHIAGFIENLIYELEKFCKDN